MENPISYGDRIILYSVLPHMREDKSGAKRKRYAWLQALFYILKLILVGAHAKWILTKGVTMKAKTKSNWAIW